MQCPYRTVRNSGSRMWALVAANDNRISSSRPFQRATAQHCWNWMAALLSTSRLLDPAALPITSPPRREESQVFCISMAVDSRGVAGGLDRVLSPSVGLLRRDALRRQVHLHHTRSPARDWSGLRKVYPGALGGQIFPCISR